MSKIVAIVFALLWGYFTGYVLGRCKKDEIQTEELKVKCQGDCSQCGEE